MYLICYDDDERYVPIAVHETAAAALRDIDRIADETSAQLAANGEGRDDFALHLRIYDQDTGEIVARGAILR